MEFFSVGVQVPPLTPSRIVPGFLNRIFFLGILPVAGLLACTPDPVDFASGIEAELRACEAAPSTAFLGVLTFESRELVEGAARAGSWKDMRRRLLVDLKGAAVDAAEAAGQNIVLRRPGGGGILLVRDGHGWRLDLALSQATFANLREVEYPAPW